jgi:hypothetical protein
MRRDNVQQVLIGQRVGKIYKSANGNRSCLPKKKGDWEVFSVGVSRNSKACEKCKESFLVKL